MTKYVPCIECGLMISDRAKSCPRCGIKNVHRRKSKVGRFLAFALALVLVFGLCFAAGVCLPPQEEQTEASQTLTAAGDYDILSQIRVTRHPLAMDLDIPLALCGNLSGFDGVAFSWEHKFLRAALTDHDTLHLTMLPHRYETLLEMVSEAQEEKLAFLLDSAPYITGISHSYSFDTITLQVDKDGLEADASFAPEDFGYIGLTYQAFLTSPRRMQLYVVDEDTGDILKTLVYPDALNPTAEEPPPEAVEPTQPLAATDVRYTVTRTDITYWQDPLGDPWAQILMELRNDDAVNLYISECIYDLVDANGEIFSSQYYTGCSSAILAPGETAYIHNQIQLIRPPETELTISLHETVQPTQLAPKHFPVSDLRLHQDFGELCLSGILENPTEEEQYIIDVSAILLDENGTCLTVLSDQISRIGPGGEIDFHAVAFALPADVTMEQVASYEVIACKMQTAS